MKIPLEWLKEYVSTKKSAKDLGQSFTALGLLLDKPVYSYESKGFKTEILDLEHRMDRSDWLSIIGCARDLAAFENTQLKFPEVYSKPAKPMAHDQRVKIEVKCPELVNRFNTRIFKGVKVKPSPDWFKNRLESYGIPSINNIVDVTNYVMVELGQPMHAQDINKMEKPEIVIRRGKKGEKMVTLLGETVQIDENCFVLTQNDLPTVLGGIVGGISTGIDESTTDIVLDAGNYNQTNIRKTSRRLKIQNETVLRYDKFLHPDLTELAIQRATALILDLAGGEYYQNEDWYHKKMPLKKLGLKLSRIELIAGFSMKPEYIKSVLTKLGYKLLKEDKLGFEFEVPYFRTDVEVEDDLVADLLRMYNYENIPTKPISGVPPKDITSKIYKFEEKVRDICVNLGLHEHITDPLVSSEDSITSIVKLENSHSQQKNALRSGLYDGLLTVAVSYFKHRFEFAELFEVGKTYARENKSKDLSDFSETRVTQVLVSHPNKSHLENSVETRNILGGLLSGLGIDSFKLSPQDNNKIGIVVDGENCGYLSWDSFVLQNEILLAYWKNPKRVLTEFANTHTDDISLIVPINTRLGEVVDLLKSTDSKISDVEIIPQYVEGIDKTGKPVVVRVTHTLSDFEELRKKLASLLSDKFQAKFR